MILDLGMSLLDVIITSEVVPRAVRVKALIKYKITTCQISYVASLRLVRHVLRCVLGRRFVIHGGKEVYLLMFTVSSGSMASR